MFNTLKKTLKKLHKEYKKIVNLNNSKNNSTLINTQSNIAYIVHDLKNPIIACQKALSLINNQKLGSLNKAQLDILNLCNNSLTFSRYLIENILISYKYDESDNILNLEQFDFIELVKECINEFNIFAIEKNINIVANLPFSKIILIDRYQLKRVVLNLLYNAIAYSKPSSDIELIVYFDESYINFSIKNIGKYIIPKDLKTIFDKKSSARNEFCKTGNGLGLYLSKKIILAHAGEIYAKSFADNSNIFGFKLPCIQEFSVI